MTLPVVTHGDAEVAIVDRLVAVWAGIELPYSPPAQDGVGVRVPVTLDGTTFIQVQHEAVIGLSTFPARERVQTRVTCWVPKGHRIWAKALADRSMAELIAGVPDLPGQSQGVGFVTAQGGRSNVVEDPDTTNLAVWFLVTTSLRGKQLNP